MRALPLPESVIKKAATIRAIDHLIVACGHQLVKDPLQCVLGDSFVLKKNIHHPTDASLIVDGIRMVVIISTKIADRFSLPGWRQHDYLNRRAKRTLRSLNRIARGRQADRNSQMKAAHIDLIEQARQVVKKADLTLFELDPLVQEKSIQVHPYWRGWIDQLHFFIAGCEYACEISAHRMLAGKTLTNKEKTFSLFEPDTDGRTSKPNQPGIK
jgi:hypothetical protein